MNLKRKGGGIVMSKVKVIPAQPQHELMRPKKVAAYCRVSTTQEMQYHSLEAQRKYFESIIGRTVNWIFVGVYAEQASGRNNGKMKEFQRMMNDCRAGKIDFIIVKSIMQSAELVFPIMQQSHETMPETAAKSQRPREPERVNITTYTRIRRHTAAKGK